MTVELASEKRCQPVVPGESSCFLGPVVPVKKQSVEPNHESPKKLR